MRAGRELSLEIAFDPAKVADRCADAFAPSGQPRRDIEALAKLGGLKVVQATPGLLTLAPAAAPVPASPAPAVPRSRSPAQVSEVVVTGRAAGPPAAEEQDSVALISVVSAAEISRRPAANVVDALSVLPGVSTFADMGLGQAATGNPEFITVRGFDATYNAYELNGMAMPQSDPNSRAPALMVIPSYGVQSVSVVKTPTAEVEGDAIGGVVDIRTPTAFDFPGELNQITVKGVLSDLAEQTGFPGAGGTVQAQFARRFAGGRLGVYLSAYDDLSKSVAESGEVGSWVPTYQSQAGLTNYAGVSSLSASEYKYDFYTNRIQSEGGELSIAWRDGGTQLYFKFTAAAYDDQGADSQMSVRHGLANTGTNAAGQVVDFWGRPVGPGLPGDPAYAPQQVSRNPGGRRLRRQGRL